MATFYTSVLGVCGSTRTRGYTTSDPYPRVGVGSSRCLTGRVGSGRVRVRRQRVRVYPVLPVRKTFFTISEREPFYFCMFSKLLVMKQ